MSLGLALTNALSGLKVNQQSLSVLSQNVANVNTPGYSRQVIQQSAVSINGLGSGVRIDEIVRKIDKYLQRSSQAQGSVSTNMATISEYYQRIQSILGQPGAGNSIDTGLTNFFNAIQSMAQTPETSSLKSNAVASATQFAKQLSDLAVGVQELRHQADGEIGDAVETINGTLKRLESLNKAIQQASALGQSVTDLLDARDTALATLSEYIATSVSYGASGAVSVVGGDGIMLLEEGISHQLRYNKAPSTQAFVSEVPLGALEVLTINDGGQVVGTPTSLLSAGPSATVTSRLVNGKLEALHQMRDVKFTSVLDQLDMLASRLRDGVNAIHNNGSGYPPATSLTGDRMIRPSDYSSWTGEVRIAALRSNGSAVPSYYADESYTGMRPLVLNLATLDAGQGLGPGKPTVQSIINEINSHFGSPGNKAELGNLNNIQLVSDTSRIPSGATSLFNFDLDLDNISTTNSSVFVTNIAVKDDVGATITNVTQDVPTATVQTTNSYITTAGSPDVTITLTSTPKVSVGDKIYLTGPGAAVNGIPAADLTGFLTVTAVNGSQITVTAASNAAATGSVNDATVTTLYPPYHKTGAGLKERTRSDGEMQVNFSGAPASAYYDITLQVRVVNDDGTVSNAPITYRVRNNEQNTFNKRYSTTAVGGAGTLVQPTSTRDSMRAIMVDVNGNELPTRPDGSYEDGEGFLKLVGSNFDEPFSVAIDEMGSKELGKPDNDPPEEGSGWRFSHYFGLNNFFASNNPTATGDTLKSSAYYLRVQDRLVQNANLISTGTLVKQNKSQLTQNKEVYAYVRYSGDNSVAQQLSGLNAQVLSFAAAGGLPDTQLTLQTYTGQVMGAISQKTAEASANAENAKTLYNTFKSKSDAISAVNLDEELANTVIFQNAYAATAKVLTTVNKLYEDLLSSF